MSFLGGIDLGSPAKQALTRDLELRRKDEKTAQRFSGYAYRGGADLVLQHGRFYSGRPLPDEYADLRGLPSACFANALAACEQRPELRYCEGYYTTGFGTPTTHGWCIAPDGGILEVTMPTRAEELGRYLNELRLPYVSPDRWGYYGVSFAARLVLAHDEVGGLPMLDRGPAEVLHHDTDPRYAHLDFSEVHDFPILKVHYDPNRTELP